MSLEQRIETERQAIVDAPDRVKKQYHWKRMQRMINQRTLAEIRQMEKKLGLN